MIVARRITESRDLKAAFAIREKVFVEEQNVPPDQEYDEHDITANHYLATYNGQPAGAARWRPTANGIKLERFAVLAGYRNRQIGRAVLKEILKDVAAAHPDKTIYLHAQVKAVPFYLRHGFSPVGELFSECDIDHYKMIYTP